MRRRTYLFIYSNPDVVLGSPPRRSLPYIFNSFSKKPRKEEKKIRMTIEFVLEIFFALKGTHDNYNDNENASHLSVIRLRVLEDPIVNSIPKN